MKDKLLNKLEKQFGAHAFIVREIPQRFYYDESTVYHAIPEAVFLPHCKEEICLFVKIALEENINIIPRGLGTGVCGGAVAFFGGVVVSLERMNMIVDLDETNMCVVVQPGLCTNELKKFLEKKYYYYPPDPQSYETSSIGGNVATNAGGPRAIKYGTTKDYVMSLKVLTGEGQMLTTGGRTYKCSSGYNLNELFCGSEGTLGLITEITLKLLPLPLKRKLLFIPFKTLQSSCNFLKSALIKGVNFSAFEFIDDISKLYVERFLNRKMPYTEYAKCYIFAELEGNENEVDIVMSLANNFGAFDIFIANDKGQEERLWEARKKISEAFKSNSKYIYKADIVVPKGSIADFVAEVKTFGSESLPLACFGHVGDGNVHINILDIEGVNKEEASKIMHSVMNCVRKYNGFPSGEHGIGIAKKEYLPIFFSEQHIMVLKQLKKVFDPKNIMNVGKIF